MRNHKNFAARAYKELKLFQGLIYSPKHWPCLENLVTVLFAIGDYAGLYLVVVALFAVLCVPVVQCTPSVASWWNARLVRGRSGFDARSSHTMDLQSGTCYFPGWHSSLWEIVCELNEAVLPDQL